MKIAFLPADPDAPGSYRCLFPMEQLAKNGHDARLPPYTMDPGKTMGYLEYQIGLNPLIPDADVYVLHLPQQDIYAKFAYMARLQNKVVVGDTDDDYINLGAEQPAYHGTNRFRSFNRHWMARTFSLCNALTVTTPHLQRVYQGINPDVRVLPNYLNWEMWEPVHADHDRERVRIGWYGAHNLRVRDTALLAEIVNPFLEKHPEVDFVLAGENVPIRRNFVRHIYVEGQTFRKRPDLVDLAAVPRIVEQIDIGLVPLQMTAFNESKSCLKGMEYNACGIPFVASPTEPYREWCEPGVNGFLAATKEEWWNHLETLLDRETRRRMGEAGRRKAKAFSIQRKWRMWAETYLELHHNRVGFTPGQIKGMSSRKGSTGVTALPVAA